jgi:hypothetical protein
LSEFKARIIDPIKTRNELFSSVDSFGNGCGGAIHPSILAAADRASSKLESLLSKIMIRRTQEDILRRLLPRRREFVVYCGLTSTQEECYAQLASEIIRYLFQRHTPLILVVSLVPNSCDGCDGSSGDAGESSLEYWCGECEEEGRGGPGAARVDSLVLPALLRLRQACNVSLRGQEEEEEEEGARPGGKRKLHTLTAPSCTTPVCDIETLLEQSAKLKVRPSPHISASIWQGVMYYGQILDAFITSLHTRRAQIPSTTIAQDNGKLVRSVDNTPHPTAYFLSPSDMRAVAALTGAGV